MKTRLTLLLALGLGLAACTSPPKRSAALSTATAAALDTTAIVRLSAEAFLARYTPEAVVIDVRTPEEFAQGHLKHAWNINVQAPDFREQIQALGLDPEAPVYLYCRSGRRSQQAAELLREMGFRKLYNIGGFEDLARAGAEVEH